MEWNKVSVCLPPENEVVDTKIEDRKGVRCERRLFRSGNLWFIEDGSMYVYNTPTHWKKSAC